MPRQVAILRKLESAAKLRRDAATTENAIWRAASIYAARERIAAARKARIKRDSREG